MVREILDGLMKEMCNSQNMNIKEEALFKYVQFACNFPNKIALIQDVNIF